MRSRINPVPIVLGLLFLAILALTVIIISPAIQPLVYLFVMSIPILLIIGLFTGIYLGFGVLAAAPVALTGLFLLFFTPSIISYKIYNNDVQKEEIKELPETGELRYMPYEVADAVGKNASTDSQIVLGEMEPFDNGGLTYVAPREPNGIRNALVEPMQGLLSVDQSGGTDRVGDDFTYGEGQILWKNWEWQAHQENYLSRKTNPYYVFDSTSDGIVMLSPYIKHRFSFPVMVPELAGVLVVRPDGTLEDLSMEEARERFPNERLVPQSMAHRYAESFAYRNGYFNATIFGRHINQPKVSSNPENAYVIPSSDGGTDYAVSASPYRSDYALYTMFFIDSSTGEVSYKNYDDEDSSVNPSRSLDIAKSKFPQYRWGSNAAIIEPRPYIRDGVLYWLSTITNPQRSGITSSVLVNANTQVVYEFSDPDTIRNGNFQDYVVGTGSTSSDAEPSPDSVTVTGTCEGNVCEITIPAE